MRLGSVLTGLYLASGGTALANTLPAQQEHLEIAVVCHSRVQDSCTALKTALKLPEISHALTKHPVFQSRPTLTYTETYRSDTGVAGYLAWPGPSGDSHHGPVLEFSVLDHNDMNQLLVDYMRELIASTLLSASENIR